MAAVRTSQDTWFAFPRLADDSGWLTLDDVDWVLVASVDTPHEPTQAHVHWMPAADVRLRFDAAYRARLAAGNVVPLGRGLWLSLYDRNAPSPVSHVGGGFGLDYPAIATQSMTEILAAMPEFGEALAPESIEAQTFDEETDTPAFDLLEAKRMIARALSRDRGGEIRFRLNHDACTVKPTGDLADDITGVKSRLGAWIDFGQLGSMTREPEFFRTLLEGGDLGLGESEAWSGCARLRRIARDESFRHRSRCSLLPMLLEPAVCPRPTSFRVAVRTRSIATTVKLGPQSCGLAVDDDPVCDSA